MNEDKRSHYTALTDGHSMMRGLVRAPTEDPQPAPDPVEMKRRADAHRKFMRTVMAHRAPQYLPGDPYRDKSLDAEYERAIADSFKRCGHCGRRYNDHVSCGCAADWYR